MRFGIDQVLKLFLVNKEKVSPSRLLWHLYHHSGTLTNWQALDDHIIYRPLILRRHHETACHD